MMTVEEAVAGRRCIRAFLPKPVPRELIERILLTAGRAPSGSNVQPWKVWVLDGAVKGEISRELADLYDAGKVSEREYNYYPERGRCFPEKAAACRCIPLGACKSAFIRYITTYHKPLLTGPYRQVPLPQCYP